MMPKALKENTDIKVVTVPSIGTMFGSVIRNSRPTADTPSSVAASCTSGETVCIAPSRISIAYPVCVHTAAKIVTYSAVDEDASQACPSPSPTEPSTEFTTPVVGWNALDQKMPATLTGMITGRNQTTLKT